VTFLIPVDFRIAERPPTGQFLSVIGAFCVRNNLRCVDGKHVQLAADGITSRCASAADLLSV